MEVWAAQTSLLEGGHYGKAWSSKPVVHQRKQCPTWVGLWKHIRSLRTDFLQKITYRVGNGSHVKFWEDKWIGNTTLREPYPRLYQIASRENSLVAHNREGNIWNPLFRRNLQVWEINDLLLLLSSLEEFKIEEHQIDRLIWDNLTEGKYTIKANYNLLCSQNGMLEDWPWKHVWKD
ncbi:uncharacterized protein LOC107812284 [Nicotiana tabacum]|uniref:Uncharacterized protein LOC107812284 n=2 Tax=Nicotiana TaxID=4085 RepID=A0A1S4BVB4_TOBAC|nr:PREDICTED: uncharacterized protein LOC104221691 [Nicotiana sylvestris]XP_016492826.1 PREDICTED: uncharacterized protein LOC107812284 [Nicotiana tabacum]